jgi:hypothetical protein
MSLGGLVLGVINVAIVVAIFLLIGALILWFCKLLLQIDIPAQVQKLYLIVVGLIALYMLVALLLGLPTWRVVRSNIPVGPELDSWQPRIIAPEQHS